HFSLPSAFEIARQCLASSLPLVISVHAINFQSSLRDFRRITLDHLHRLLNTLEEEYPALCYIHDVDLWQIVHYGKYDHASGTVTVSARNRRFRPQKIEAEKIA